MLWYVGLKAVKTECWCCTSQSSNFVLLPFVSVTSLVHKMEITTLRLSQFPESLSNRFFMGVRFHLFMQHWHPSEGMKDGVWGDCGCGLFIMDTLIRFSGAISNSCFVNCAIAALLTDPIADWNYVFTQIFFQQRHMRWKHTATMNTKISRYDCVCRPS